jgi:RND superfamily putative drug exporter
MAILGSRNWYLPSWLHWLPNVSIEGHARAPRPGVVEGAPAD